jgi:hypothetical protein
MKISELRPQHLEAFQGKLSYIGFQIPGEFVEFWTVNGKVDTIESGIDDPLYQKIEDIADKIDVAFTGNTRNLNLIGLVLTEEKLVAEPTFIVYEIFDRDAGKYLNTSDLITFCKVRGLEPLPIYHIGPFDLTLDQVSDLVNSAQLTKDVEAEGIVIGTIEEGEAEFLPNRRAILHLEKD